MAKGEPVKVHELGPYLKNMYRKRYQCTQFSTCIIDYRVSGLELTVELVEIMVQDSGKEKSHRKEKTIYQRKRQIHMLRNEKQF